MLHVALMLLHCGISTTRYFHIPIYRDFELCSRPRYIDHSKFPIWRTIFDLQGEVQRRHFPIGHIRGTLPAHMRISTTRCILVEARGAIHRCTGGSRYGFSIDLHHRLGACSGLSSQRDVRTNHDGCRATEVLYPYRDT